MAKVNIAVLVGSNRRDSLNRKLAQALVNLGADRSNFHFVAIDDLPLYNQDLEAVLPPSVVQFKKEIAAADARGARLQRLDRADHAAGEKHPGEHGNEKRG